VTKHTALLVLVTLFLASCATITTRSVRRDQLDSAPEGVRVYAPKVYLFVDAVAHKSTLANLPDYGRAYDVKPLTIFAKQDFNIKTDVGQPTDVTSNQDTTAFLTFVQGAAQMAVKAGGLPASITTMDGDFGLASGVYALGEDGTWQPAALVPPPQTAPKAGGRR